MQNNYFQVFHICEGGKKISFLCPNGTIFQQTDLICDWWFKVNCAASPGHYAESSEILSRAQHRYKPHSNQVNRDSPTATANPFGSTTNIASQKADLKQPKSLNPFDFQSESSNESYDFENISGPSRQAASRETSSRQASSRPTSSRNSGRRSKAYSRDTSKVSSKETQEVAASSSFVGSDNSYNGFNGYHYREPTENKFTLASEKKTTTAAPTTTTSTTTPSPTAAKSEKDEVFAGYNYLPPERTSRRLDSTRAPGPTTTTIFDTERTTTEQPSSYASQRETTTSRINNGQEQTEDASVETTTTQELKPTTKAPSLIRNTLSPLIRNSSALLNRVRGLTTRTTPFYTPTVPTIINSRPTAESTTLSSSETLPTPSPLSVSEHAIEMMKTLQELKLDTTVQPTASSDSEYDKLRPGLLIPPSSGPDALNALAIFYATATDNLALNRSDSTQASFMIPGLENLDVEIGNVSKLSSALLSNSTVQKYEDLFGIDANREGRKDSIAEINSNLQTGPSSENDLETEFSNNPILAAAGTPQIRELAQVFTHALSAYLHDPQTFRRVLSEIRPTEPNVPKSTEFLTNRIGRTDDFNKGTGPTYLPTASTLSATATTNAAPTTEDLEVLEFSDVTTSTINKETIPTTTDSNDESSTPSSGGTTTTYASTFTTPGLSTTHTQILKKSLKHIDHVPASRILTEGLEHSANNHLVNSAQEGTTESSNPLAMEINGGLVITTNFPYLQDDFDNNGTGYFPLKNRNSDDNDDDNRSHQPYGHGVKPSNSTPIYDQNPTESSEEITTTEIPISFDLLPPATINKGFSLPINDILPPIDENDLQRAQSQSIYGNGNDVSDRGGKSSRLTDAKATTLKPMNGHYITQTIPTSTESPELLTRTTVPDSGKISTSPWSTLAYTVFLDPLTINDGLMEANDGTVTPSPHTYLPKSTHTPSYAEVSQTTTETISLRELADAGRRGKAIVTSTGAPIPTEYMDVMQQKANEMFGALNETSAGHLMNVMKKAEKNKTVRRLILLLIQTCDDDYNTTVEESRTALLNALIGMDGKIDEENEVQIIKSQRNPNRSGKSIAAPGNQNVLLPDAPTTSFTQIPITTYHRPILELLNRNGDSSSTPQYVVHSTTAAPTTAATTEFDSDSDSDSLFKSTTTDFVETETTTNYPTVTETPSTVRTTVTTAKSTTANSRRKTVTDARRVSKDLDQFLIQPQDSLQVDASHKHSDTRALELLRSLYSLAGRFGK